ncbi:hypothetical protein LTR27_003901 [Elasticomyces elasticus]|nr:hypothetical protein LTR27_003901 [Elasticomyces elasticus]
MAPLSLKKPDQGEDHTNAEHQPKPEKKRKAATDAEGLAKKTKLAEGSDSDVRNVLKREKGLSALERKIKKSTAKKRTGTVSNSQTVDLEVHADSAPEEEIAHTGSIVSSEDTAAVSAAPVEHLSINGHVAIVRGIAAIEDPAVLHKPANIKDDKSIEKRHAMKSAQSKDESASKSTVAEGSSAKVDIVAVGKPTSAIPHKGKKNTGRFEKLDKPLSGWYRQQAARRSLGQSRSGLAHLHLPARRWQYFSKYNQKDAAPPAYSVLDPRQM